MLGNERAILAKQYWQTAHIDFKDGNDADSFAEFQQRVATFLNRLDDFEHNSFFFGHGIWIGMLAWQLLGYLLTITLIYKNSVSFKLLYQCIIQLSIGLMLQNNIFAKWVSLK